MCQISEIRKCFVVAFVIAVLWFSIALSIPAYAEEKSIVDINRTEYFDMKPLFFPVLTRYGVTENISLLISIEIGKGNVDLLYKYRARLADAYIQNLYGAFSEGEAMIYGNVVDVENVQERLLTVTQEVLGEKYVVNNILLKVVQQ